IQNRQLVYNETISLRKAGTSAFLPTPPTQVFTLPPSTASVWPVTKSLSAEARNTRAPSRSWGCSSRCAEPEWTGRSRAVARWRGAEVGGIAAHHGVDQGDAGRKGVDGDPVPAELARERPRERHDAALRRDVVQHPGDAAKGGAGADIDDLAVALRDHVRGDVL